MMKIIIKMFKYNLNNNRKLMILIIKNKLIGLMYNKKNKLKKNNKNNLRYNIKLNRIINKIFK